MIPKEFDIKYKELQEIERRMSNYSRETPLSKVWKDHTRAKDLYNELTKALEEFQRQITIEEKNDKRSTTQ